MPAPAGGKAPPIGTVLQEERVRRRAYELYIRRGNQSGSEIKDWLQAEQDICRVEEAIDETSKQSFPASDPPAR